MMLTLVPFVTTPERRDSSTHPAVTWIRETLTSDQQKFEAMVAYMDTLVGQIADKLDGVGVRENTLILFTGITDHPGGTKVVSSPS